MNATHPAPDGPEPFVRAVVRQLRGPFAAGAADDAAGGAGKIELDVRRMVCDASDAGLAEDAARRLAGDPPLLASFFQNVDLLYAHGFERADAVSMLVMRALEMLEEPRDG